MTKGNEPTIQVVFHKFPFSFILCERELLAPSLGGIQSLGEYHWTKSSRTESGFAAWKDLISDKSSVVCNFCLFCVPSNVDPLFIGYFQYPYSLFYKIKSHK